MQPVEFIHVTHSFGEGDILYDVSVRFAENKVTAIIGKSGSGKSTLLKIVNGLSRPAAGEVRLFGEKLDYNALGLLRKKLGYVVQGIGLFPHLTAEENILLPGKTHLPKTELNKDRVHELMNLVNLQQNLKGKYPYQMSGGEQQRVGICRALFLAPLVLLMDEPFGSLDPITRFDIHREFIELQRKMPRTVLLVTHDMAEAKKLADEILVLDRGTVQQFGPKQEIFEHPATNIVKELLIVAGL